MLHPFAGDATAAKLESDLATVIRPLFLMRNHDVLRISSEVTLLPLATVAYYARMAHCLRRQLQGDTFATRKGRADAPMQWKDEQGFGLI